MDVLDPLQLHPEQKSPLAPLAADASRLGGNLHSSRPSPGRAGCGCSRLFLWHLFIIGNMPRNHQELFPFFFISQSLWSPPSCTRLIQSITQVPPVPPGARVKRTGILTPFSPPGAVPELAFNGARPGLGRVCMPPSTAPHRPGLPPAHCARLSCARQARCLGQAKRIKNGH